MLNAGSGVKPTAPSEGSVAEAAILKGDPDAGAPVTIRNLFTHHDVHPVVLDLAMLKEFGEEWYLWESATLWSEIKRLFKTDVSELTRAKIQTVKSIHSSPLPWTKWQVFEKIVQGLNNNIPTWETMQVPSLEQLYVGVDILETFRKEDFSDEVCAYIASAVLNDEVSFVPAPLDFVQAEVAQPYLKCADCGLQESSLFHDGICTSCSKKTDPESGLGMKPSNDKGKNVIELLQHDFRPVEARWQEVGRKPSSEIEFNEDVVDSQLSKLILARDYMNVRRRQLADQLTSLKSWLGAE
jgi:hypothetical protein